MNAALEPTALVFREDGTPYSPRHDDIYHSAAGALAQSRQVFIEGNGLPSRWRDQRGFTVLELGFGMGVNFLATWRAWLDDSNRSQTLRFVSIEKYPFNAGDLRRAHAAIIDDARLDSLASTLADAWPALTPGMHRLIFDVGAVELLLIFGDAADALRFADTEGIEADAIYLDGFAPAKNPDMWTTAIFSRLAALSNPLTTFATYTSAGSVKRALKENGFDYRKVRGFGGKRAMLVGKRAA